MDPIKVIYDSKVSMSSKRDENYLDMLMNENKTQAKPSFRHQTIDLNEKKQLDKIVEDDEEVKVDNDDMQFNDMPNSHLVLARDASNFS